jgi:uncharacterized BrkB/YihY/UPF0761 family membrane protein
MQILLLLTAAFFLGLSFRLPPASRKSWRALLIAALALIALEILEEFGGYSLF